MWGPPAGNELDLCLVEVGKIEYEVSGLKRLFFRSLKSLTARDIILCLDETEEFKRRDLTIS